MSNGSEAIPEHEPIPSGLCDVLGCVFLYGHRGLHSWAQARRSKRWRR